MEREKFGMLSAFQPTPDYTNSFGPRHNGYGYGCNAGISALYMGYSGNAYLSEAGRGMQGAVHAGVSLYLAGKDG